MKNSQVSPLLLRHKMGNQTSMLETSTIGLHVLKNKNVGNGLQAFFDFITHVNGIRLNADIELLSQKVKENVGRPLNLIVYSSKTQKLRNVNIVPTDSGIGVSVAVFTLNLGL